VNVSTTHSNTWMAEVTLTTTLGGVSLTTTTPLQIVTPVGH
jgi:hypothetical protein